MSKKAVILMKAKYNLDFRSKIVAQNPVQFEMLMTEQRLKVKQIRLTSYPNATPLFNKMRKVIKTQFTFNEK